MVEVGPNPRWRRVGRVRIVLRSAPDQTNPTDSWAATDHNHRSSDDWRRRRPLGSCGVSRAAPADPGSGRLGCPFVLVLGWCFRSDKRTMSSSRAVRRPDLCLELAPGRACVGMKRSLDHPQILGGRASGTRLGPESVDLSLRKHHRHKSAGPLCSWPTLSSRLQPDSTLPRGGAAALAGGVEVGPDP